MRDHGGDLDAAILLFGGKPADWLDLSTGINRTPYSLPPFAPRVLRDLPRSADIATCASTALSAYGAADGVDCLPLAGAQAAIRLVPGLRPAGRVGIVGPTYNEHAAAFAAAGWRVTEVSNLSDLKGFDAVVIVNPNNPDGRRWRPEALVDLASKNGLVIIDESFADVDPEVSACSRLGRPGVVVLRSLGKFFGLAGLRLGFALGAEPDIAQLREAAGPWPVSGPALAAGSLALADTQWTDAMRDRLAKDADRLDSLAGNVGWRLVGGCELFRLYDTQDAIASQARLARGRVWSRAFPYSREWLRLGLPGPETEWTHLAEALAGRTTVSRGAGDTCP